MPGFSDCLPKAKMFLAIFAIPIMIAMADFSVVFAGELQARVYPLPLTELETVVARWLSDSGFEVHRSLPERGQVTLSAVRANDRWQLSLSVHSPLATRLEVYHWSGDQPEPLWKYLARYSRRVSAQDVADSRQAIPADVLSKVEAVVCIKAKVKEKDLQFSGFVVDEKGLILCTGHDLEINSRVSVMLSDGRTFMGTVVRLDPRRDLALVSASARLPSVINLNQGGDRLADNEQLFSVGCPLNVMGVVQSGVLRENPRRLLNGFPLWQADMIIQLGSSGSPVFDAGGRLVGVVKGRYRGTDYLGFLIPFETVLDFLEEP